MENAELIKALREDAEWAHANEWETPITLGDHLDAAATALEAADKRVKELEAALQNWHEDYHDNPPEAAQRWIPVEEQLPEHDQDVLAITKAGNLSVGQNIVTCTFCKPRNEKHGLFYLPYTMGRTLIVTHWQPLPSTEGIKDGT